MARKNLSDLFISAFAFAAIYLLLFRRQEMIRYISPPRFVAEAFETPIGWGYRIRQDTTTVIEQRSVLHIAKNRGFQTREQALATAQLVKQKLDKGVFPPAISKHEIDSLGIR